MLSAVVGAIAPAGSDRRALVERHLLFTLAFAIAAALGRATIIDKHSASMVWPAGGVALLWWLWARAHGSVVPVLVLLGVVTAAVNVATGTSVEVGAVFGLANVAQAALAAYLARSLLAEVSLGSLRGAGVLFVAAVVSAALGASLMTAGVSVAEGSAAVDLTLSLQWWGRNVTGIIVVAAVGLLVLEQRAPARPGSHPALPLTRRRLLEAVVLAVLTTGCFVLLFASNGRSFGPLLAFTLWAGLRFPPVVVAGYTTACGVCSVVLTLVGLGPFAAVADLTQRSTDVQIFLLSLMVLGLVLSGSLADQRRLVVRAEDAERVATARADLHAAVVEVMEEGLVVVDAVGTVVAANAAAARLVGAVVGESVHRDDTTILHPDDTPVAAHDMPLLRAMQDGHSPARDLLVIRGTHHSPVVLAVSATRLADVRPYGAGSGAVLLFRDVTDDRTQRDELAAFARVVAHDLRGPLAGVRGWLELSLSEVLLDPARVDVNGVAAMLPKALDSAERMGSLIDDLLLQASRADSALHPTDVQLEDLVAEVVALYDADGVVTVGNLSTVCVDAVQVRQLLGNLVGNAVKYVDEGVRPQIRIESHVVGAEVEVWVTDNGIGIPESERSEVFRPLHRAHPERGDISGSGLGLALCRTIVERHGGRIEVQPAPGRGGSRFVLTLPRARYDDDRLAWDGAGITAELGAGVPR